MKADKVSGPCLNTTFVGVIWIDTDAAFRSATHELVESPATAFSSSA